MKSIASVSIVGAGNVAYHLGKAFSNAGIKIDFIFSRTQSNTQKLADLVDAKTTNVLADLQKSDLIICATPDDTLIDLIPILAPIAPVVATSGTFNVLALELDTPIGVFYPLQTFSKSKVTDFSVIPLFIESNTVDFNEILLELGKKMSRTVVELAWEKRKTLHLAAVFANNFTNHLIDIAQQQLQAAQLPFEWIQPLLNETLAKLEFQSAKDAQTGPARRNDQQTIQQHILMLPAEEAKIYELLTASIQQRFSNHDKL